MGRKEMSKPVNGPTTLRVAAPATWVLAPAGAWRVTEDDRRRPGAATPSEPLEGWPHFRAELLAVLRQARGRAERASDCLVAVPVPSGLSPSTVSLMRRWLAQGSAPTWHVESGRVVQGGVLVSAMFRSGLPSVPVVSATTLEMVTHQQPVAPPALPSLTEDVLARWQTDHVWWATPAARAWRLLNPRHAATTRTLLECLDSRLAVAAAPGGARPSDRVLAGV
jgi:hypothetical protein